MSPSILDTGTQSVKAELDKVAKNQLAAEVGTDGRLMGSINTTRKGFTFTAYIKALVTGQKAISGGVRVEKTF